MATTTARTVDEAVPDLGCRSAAEGLAAFAVVFAGCGAVVANSEYHGALGAVGVSLVFGLVIMVMVYVVGPVLGAMLGAFAYQVVRSDRPSIVEEVEARV